AGLAAAFAIGTAVLAARGATPSAFERRCIPAGCVAPPSNIPDILSRRALPSGRLAVLGATMDLHHGLLAQPPELDDLPDKTADYVAGYKRDFAGVVADETYRQEAH